MRSGKFGKCDHQRPSLGRAGWTSSQMAAQTVSMGLRAIDKLDALRFRGGKDIEAVRDALEKFPVRLLDAVADERQGFLRERSRSALTSGGT